MSLTSSPELEGLASVSNEPECGPQPSVKSTPTAERYLPDTGPMSQSTMTSASSMAASTQDQLTLFAEDIPASLSVPQASNKVKKTRAISGRKCAESFEKHAPVGSLPRMFADMLASVSTPLPHNWKMTASPSGRLLFQLAPSALPTEGTDSGFWPTIRATDGERGGRGDLIQAVRGNPNSHYRLWPTPTVNGNHNQKGLSEKSGDGLATAVKLWPTPHANCSTGASNTQQGGVNLQTAVKMWPTPRASEHKGCGPLGSPSHQHWLEKHYLHAHVQEKEQATGQLNPQWVDWLMGFPTEWTASEQPGTQLSLKSLNSSDELFSHGKEP
jgi:hypothetical protein